MFVCISTKKKFEFCFGSILKMKITFIYQKQATRKAPWNPAGVEPVRWKPANIDTGSLKLVKIGKYF